MLRAKSEGCFILILSRSSPFPFCLTGNESLFTLGNTVAAYFILLLLFFIIFQAEKRRVCTVGTHIAVSQMESVPGVREKDFPNLFLLGGLVVIRKIKKIK